MYVWNLSQCVNVKTQMSRNEASVSRICSICSIFSDTVLFCSRYEMWRVLQKYWMQEQLHACVCANMLLSGCRQTAAWWMETSHNTRPLITHDYWTVLDVQYFSWRPVVWHSDTHTPHPIPPWLSFLFSLPSILSFRLYLHLYRNPLKVIARSVKQHSIVCNEVCSRSAAR